MMSLHVPSQGTAAVVGAAVVVVVVVKVVAAAVVKVVVGDRHDRPFFTNSHVVDALHSFGVSDTPKVACTCRLCARDQ